MGCHFAKWRAVIAIDVRDRLPSDACIAANAHALARYAALCVEQGLVPIVEPEVLMDGNHTIEDCYAATERTLQWVFAELYRQRVPLEQMVLRSNMVLSGSECPKQASSGEIAAATLRCLRRTVPPAVPGVVFLSSGQTGVEATVNLNEINRRGRHCPWRLSFAYGRALQASALLAWQGRAENEPSARQTFYLRAKLNGAACLASYESAMEATAASQ
jgi:fructose-bisphosphate aldolase class I